MAGEKQQDLVGKNVKRGLLIFLIIANTFFLFKFFEYKNVKDEIQSKLALEEQQISTLEKDLERYIGELSKTKELNKQLNDLLKKTYEQLASIKIELQNYEGPTKGRILRRIISTEKYLSTIDSLILENQILLAENKQLKENISLERKISTQLRDEKEKLEMDLMVESQIRAENITCTGLKKSRGTEERPTEFVDQLDKLKVCFDLNSSSSSVAGRKVIYMQLADPKGTILADGDKALLHFELEDGHQISYTTEMSVSTSAKKKSLCLYVKKNASYKAGDYQIRFYAESELIGLIQFPLK